MDPQHARITAVHVGGSKRPARFVPWEHITSFGADAVMVDGIGAARDATGPAEDRVANGDGDVLGKRLLTDSGDQVGVVDDVDFDATDGRIEHLTVGDETISGDRLLGIGTFAVVVRADDDGGA